MVNSQNNYWLALSSQDILILMKIKLPVHIMVFGQVTSDGDPMPPPISPHGLRLNMESKSLEEVMLALVERVASWWSYL